MTQDILISVGKIYSPSMGIIKNGAIWIQNGIVKKIFKKHTFKKPANAIVKKYANAFAYPGFVEPHSHITVIGTNSGERNIDINERTELINPHMKIRDAINLDSNELELSRREGVVAAAVLPGSASLIGGLGCFIKTTCKTLIVDEVIVKDDIGLKLSFGENPKRVFSIKDKLITRMGVAGHLRLYFQNVLNYMDKKEKETDLKYEIGIRLLNHEFPARVHAHQANDIQTAINLSEEFNFKIVLDHCSDGDRIADYLKSKKIPAVVGPFLSSSFKIECRNLNLAMPRILSNTGVETSITTDAPIDDIILLRFSAGLAIKNGMDYMQALKSITSNPAKVCGVQDRYGDIKEGMEAHFVIWEGDPLRDIQAKVIIITDKNELWTD